MTLGELEEGWEGMEGLR